MLPCLVSYLNELVFRRLVWERFYQGSMIFSMLQDESVDALPCSGNKASAWNPIFAIPQLRINIHIRTCNGSAIPVCVLRRDLKARQEPVVAWSSGFTFGLGIFASNRKCPKYGDGNVLDYHWVYWTNALSILPRPKETKAQSTV